MSRKTAWLCICLLIPNIPRTYSLPVLSVREGREQLQELSAELKNTMQWIFLSSPVSSQINNGMTSSHYWSELELQPLFFIGQRCTVGPLTDRSRWRRICSAAASAAHASFKMVIGTRGAFSDLLTIKNIKQQKKLLLASNNLQKNELTACTIDHYKNTHIHF